MMTTHQQVHPAYALVMLTGRGIGRETVLSTVYRAREWEHNWGQYYGLIP